MDSILDLLIPGQSPGIKEKIIDLYGRPEILFFGPDEGTADYMDWASQHARKRFVVHTFLSSACHNNPFSEMHHSGKPLRLEKANRSAVYPTIRMV